LKKTFVFVSLLLGASAAWAKCGLDVAAVEKLTRMPVEEAKVLAERKGCTLMFNGERHGAYGHWVQRPQAPDFKWPTGAIVALVAKNQESMEGVVDHTPRIAVAVLNLCAGRQMYCTLTPAGAAKNTVLSTMGVVGGDAEVLARAAANAKQTDVTALTATALGEPQKPCRAFDSTSPSTRENRGCEIVPAGFEPGSSGHFEATAQDRTFSDLIARLAKLEGRDVIWSEKARDQADTSLPDFAAVDTNLARFNKGVGLSRATSGAEAVAKLLAWLSPTLTACIFSDAVVIQTLFEPQCGATPR
jgi:hypothetical protein